MPLPKLPLVKGRVIDSGDQLSKKMLMVYIFILALAMSLIPFTIDPYLPAFPAIGQFFGVANGVVQASFTGVTVGIAAGQLLIGPLSDAFGRRPLLLMTMTGYLLATIFAFFAPNIEVFILLRFFMGFFAAGGDVVARAVIRDLFRGQPMRQMLARVFLVQSLAPILGPILGSQLTELIAWQGVFLLFAIVTLVLLLFANAFLIETLPVSARRSSSPLGLARGYVNVLRDRVFIGLMFYAALQLSALFTYLNFVPFVFQEGFGVSATDTGVWMAVNGAASYIGVQLGAYLARFIQGHWLLAVYALIGIGVGLGLFLTSGTSFFWAETLFLIELMIFGAGLTVIPTIALYNHGSEAGTASSLLGVFNFTLASVISGIYFLLDTDSTGDLGILIGLLFGGSFLALIFITRPWLLPDMRKADV
ncbi:MAG: Bcr/CflA family efflux MFS transporter [Actinobacteria bacterium]|nr:Bcr/CflA family efflux MFS transporter [Actinomycetota bacterium]